MVFIAGCFMYLWRQKKKHTQSERKTFFFFFFFFISWWIKIIPRENEIDLRVDSREINLTPWWAVCTRIRDGRKKKKNSVEKEKTESLWGRLVQRKPKIGGLFVSDRDFVTRFPLFPCELFVIITILIRFLYCTVHRNVFFKRMKDKMTRNRKKKEMTCTITNPRMVP